MPNYVTKVQVHNAADVVNDKGKRPSADSVRVEIGHGSNSTILEHLKTWVPRDQRLTLPPIPDSLRESVETLVADFWFIALTDANDQFNLKLAKETAERVEAQEVASAAGVQIDQLKSELAACLDAAAVAEKTSIERDRILEEQKARIDSLQTEVAKRSAQVETLKAMLTEFSPNKKQKSMEFADKA
jgi:Plasmid replication region DNA-binding N-term